MAVDSANCCLCLTDSENLINVFQEEESNQGIAEVLNQLFFWFEIKENDSRKYICSSCWTKVDSFHNFYIQVFNNHYESLAKVKIEIEEDNPTNHDFVKLEPIEEDQTDKESEKSFNDDNNFIEMTVENAEQNMKIKRVKLRHQKEDQDEMERENQQIREYLELECEICSMKFDKFKNVQTHYRKEHSLRGYLRCCNRKYTERSLLVEHIQKHINPDAFKCELCNRVYSNKRGLEGHMEKSNDCPKRFSTKTPFVQACVHKNEENNFICNECGKLFGTKALLKIHKNEIHEDAFIHICDICSKVFQSKLTFERHHKSVHEKKILPKVQCHICSKWLKHKYYLRQHLSMHQESKVSCNICEKEYLNRKSLRKHISAMHTNKLYECSLCIKTFKKSLSLKEHMATHNGIALYACPYCPKTCNSSGNMCSHKKKHHAKELKEQDILKKAGAI